MRSDVQELDWLTQLKEANQSYKIRSPILTADELQAAIQKIVALEQTKFYKQKFNQRLRTVERHRVYGSEAFIPGNRTPFVKWGSIKYACVSHKNHRRVDRSTNKRPRKDHPLDIVEEDCDVHFMVYSYKFFNEEVLYWLPEASLKHAVRRLNSMPIHNLKRILERLEERFMIVIPPEGIMGKHNHETGKKSNSINNINEIFQRLMGEWFKLERGMIPELINALKVQAGVLGIPEDEVPNKPQVYRFRNRFFREQATKSSEELVSEKSAKSEISTIEADKSSTRETSLESDKSAAQAEISERSEKPKQSASSEQSAQSDQPAKADKPSNLVNLKEEFEGCWESNNSQLRVQQVVEHQAIEHQAVEHQAVEHQAVEPQAIEHQAVEHQAVEPQAIEHQAIEHQAVEPQAIEHQAVEHQAIEHQAVEPRAVEHQAIKHPKVENESDARNVFDFEPLTIYSTEDRKRKIQRALYILETQCKDLIYKAHDTKNDVWLDSLINDFSAVVDNHT